MTLHKRFVPEGYRWCSAGDKCVNSLKTNPLPLNKFSKTSNYCKECNEHKHRNKYKPHSNVDKPDRHFIKNAPAGFKYCSNLDKCVNRKSSSGLLPLSEFYFTGGKPRSHCSACMLKERKDWFDNGGYEKHREKFISSAQKRHSMKNNQPFDFNERDAKQLLVYFDYKCAFDDVSCFGKLEFDHYIPVNDKSDFNPGYVPSNVIVLCSHHNKSKSDKPPLGYLISTFGKTEGYQIHNRVLEFFKTVRKTNSKVILKPNVDS